MAFDLDDTPNTAPTTEEPESAGIIDERPEPQEHAIQANSDSTESQPQSSDTVGLFSNETGDKDDAGEVWNAATHATGKDGKGVKTAKGLWRRRKGTGSGPRAASKVYKPADHTAAQAEAKAQEVASAGHRMAGTAIASSIFMLGRAFGGEHWAPTPEEVTQNSDAWTAYCAAKGIQDFPPGVTVLIATCAYAGPRFFQKETKERVGTIKNWFAVRVARWRVKKALRKRGIEAKVTIQGSAGNDPLDSILVDGKPFNEKEHGTKEAK